MTATGLRGHGFCMEGDANLSRQLIHQFKPLPLLGSLPSPVCSEQALLTWAEEALECQGRFNSPLCKMNARSGMLVQTKNSPAAPSLGLQPARALRGIL